MDKKLYTDGKIIATSHQWKQVEHYFSAAPAIGLDTEFMRERTYYPQLCLVQLSTPHIAVCIDTLAVNFAGELASLLTNRGIMKIIHAASQDVEVLGYYCDADIANIFDTQLAAEFCNFTPQTGYAALVSELLDVDLPKSQTRSNWAKRPLSPKQIEYSLNDVEYLHALHQQLSAMLHKCQTQEWYQQEQQVELERMLNFRLPPDQAYLNFKCSHRLAARNQQVIKQLLTWREQIAQRDNKPKNWILSDKSITEIGSVLPQEREVLERMLKAEPRFNNAYIKEIMACIKEGLNQPDQLVWKRTKPLSETQKEQVKGIRQKLDRQATTHNLPVTRVATRKDVVQFVTHRQGRLAEGWRKTLMDAAL